VTDAGAGIFSSVTTFTNGAGTEAWQGGGKWQASRVRKSSRLQRERAPCPWKRRGLGWQGLLEGIGPCPAPGERWLLPERCQQTPRHLLSLFLNSPGDGAATISPCSLFQRFTVFTVKFFSGPAQTSFAATKAQSAVSSPAGRVKRALSLPAGLFPSLVLFPVRSRRVSLSQRSHVPRETARRRTLPLWTVKHPVKQKLRRPV